MARRQHQNSVTLFPFLAVLVCAMGSLILLLLVMTRKIRHDQLEAAEGAAQLQSIAALPDLSTEIASADQQILALRSTLQQRTDEIGRLRNELTAEEEASARLQSDLTQLQDRLTTTTADESGSDQLSAELDKLREREAELLKSLSETEKSLLEKREHLAALEDSAKESELQLHEKLSALVNLRKQADAAKNKAAAATGTETLLEFSNATGTSRLPIVIDVTSKGFEFLPNGFHISPKDMENFPVRDNPLLSAIVTIHRHRSGGSVVQEPYVLLLVRPDGCLAFYGAQRILIEAKIHYGYELLPADRVIESGTPDSLETPLVEKSLVEVYRRRDNLYAKLMAIARQESPDGAPFGSGESETPRPQDRRLSVRPDGRVVEEEPRTRRQLEGRYYAGGVAPPSSFYGNRAAARVKGAPAGRLSADDAERIAEEFAQNWANERSRLMASAEQQTDPSQATATEAPSSTSAPVAAVQPSDVAGTDASVARSESERRFANAIFGSDGTLQGARLVNPGSLANDQRLANTAQPSATSGTVSTSGNSFGPTSSTNTTGGTTGSEQPAPDWFQSAGRSSESSASSAAGSSGQKTGLSSSLIAANGSDSGSSRPPDLSQLDPELLRQLKSAHPRGESTVVGIVVFLDERFMTVAQQPAVSITERNADAAVAALLKAINTEVQDARKRPLEPMMPVVRFVVSPGGEQWRILMSRQLRDAGIRSVSSWELTPYIVADDTTGHAILDSPAEIAP